MPRKTINLAPFLNYPQKGFSFLAANIAKRLAITGYDEFNVTYYDPSLGNVKMGLAKASSMFENTGNIFISYIN